MIELPKIYFDKLLQSSPDIVVGVDRRGAIIFYNDGAKQTLGYTASEVLGKNVAMVYPSADEARRVMAALHAPTKAATATSTTSCASSRTRPGTLVPVAISGSLIHDQRGKEHGSIGFAKEIAELQLREQIETLGELAVGLAHSG